MASRNVDIPGGGSHKYEEDSTIIGSPPKSDSSGIKKFVSNLSASFSSKESRKDAPNTIFRDDEADNDVLLRKPDEVRLADQNSCDIRSGRVIHFAKIEDDQYGARVNYMHGYLDKIKDEIGEKWETKAKASIVRKFPQMKKVMSGGALESAEPMPATAGSWGLIDVNIIPEGEIGNVITQGRSTNKSVSAELSPAFMGARLGAIKVEHGKSDQAAEKITKID